MTLFLAQFLGLFFLIAGLLLLTKAHDVQKALNELKSSPALMLISGLLYLIFGLFIILSHPEWQMNWSTLITIAGYFFFIKGIIRLFFPAFFIKFIAKMKMPILTYFGIITLIFGLLLTYQGFFIR